MFLLGILIFKGLNARRLYKSFGVKGLTGQEMVQKLQGHPVVTLTVHRPVKVWLLLPISQLSLHSTTHTKQQLHFTFGSTSWNITTVSEFSRKV
jgi:hypothetical protein